MAKRNRCILARLGAFIAVVAATGSSAAAPLTIIPSVNPVPAGISVAFQIAPNVLNPGDTVSFNFGDGSTGKVDYTTGCGLLGGCPAITHAYAGPGVFTVSATGTISAQAVSGAVQITVTTSTADQAIYVPTGAHLTGYNDVNWRTDLEINNPGTTRVSYAITLLLRNQNNSAPAFTSTFTLNPGRSARYGDLLYGTFGFSGAAAIRLTPIDGPILVTSRTYNQLPTGTYGQSVPASPRAVAIGFDQDAYLIGLAHDPTLAAGYRTNLGFVNASPAGIHVEADFYLASGEYLGRTSYDLLPFEFRQIDRAFEQVTPNAVDDGYIVVRTTTAGAKFFAYAVVTDNLTGDPTYVTAVAAP
jgi:PKD domain